jgi:protein required for attachment to host cells
MARHNIDQGDWVVVCDGKKALLLENVGDAVFPNLKTKEVHEQDVAKTHEQGAGTRGRAFGSAGGVRSAVAESDRHDQSERAFLEDLAGRLDAAVTAGETKSLIIVAPPRALGLLRQAYSPHVRQAVRAELDKDLVRMPVHEIEKHLVG